jgi:methionine-rich copper-binding protein CopC
MECTVTREILHALAFDSSVVRIGVLPEGKPCGTTRLFSILADAALNPAAHPADRGGEGLHVAMVEQGTDQWHIDQVRMCLRNAAPDAVLLHKEARFYDNMNTEGWLVDNNIATTSLSISRDPDWVSANSSEFMLMDDFAYRWPYPLFCTPAGNTGSTDSASMDVEVNWQSYGALCVGSVKHWREQAFVFDDFTAARNPDPLWGSCPDGDSACGGDRELPELLVPGSHPYAPPGEDDSPYLWAERIDSLYCSAQTNPESTYVCSTYYVNLWHGQGTSYSAPIANGMAARLISSNPSLFQNKPDCVKMALLLTAHNVEGGYWDPGEDGRDGAGVISTHDAVAYGQTCTDLTHVDTPTPVVTGLYTAEADSTLEEKTFRIRMPDTLPDGRHFRAVLVWTSNPDFENNVNALSDLDLGGFVDDSGDTYGSYSLDASVEMFDVPRSRVTAGKEYAFTVYPRDIRIPHGARTDFFYLTVGWAWVRDHADSTVAAIKWAAEDMRRGSRPTNVHVTARVRSAAAVEVSLAEGMSAAACDITVFDAKGRALATHRVRSDSPDARRVVVPLKTPLAYGLYVVRVSVDGCRADAVACVNDGRR